MAVTVRMSHGEVQGPALGRHQEAPAASRQGRKTPKSGRGRGWRQGPPGQEGRGRGPISIQMRGKH